MTESPDERRWDRNRRRELANALSAGYDEARRKHVPGAWFSALDALLDALEPPVAEMVRRGVVRLRDQTPATAAAMWEWFTPAPKEEP